MVEREMCIFLHCLSLWSLHLNSLPSRGASGFFSYVQHYQADRWAWEKRPSFVRVHATSVSLGLQMLFGIACYKLRVTYTHTHTRVYTHMFIPHNVTKNSTLYTSIRIITHALLHDFKEVKSRQCFTDGKIFKHQMCNSATFVSWNVFLLRTNYFQSEESLMVQTWALSNEYKAADTLICKV